MRVLLINPPVTRPLNFAADKVRISPFIPLGLAMIAAVLEKAGHEVKILDALIEGDLQGFDYFDGKNKIRYGLPGTEIAKQIYYFNPDYVGVSCIFSAMEDDAISICRLSKSVKSTIKTIIGGPWAGTNVESLSKNIYIDHIIQGEGEKAILDIVNKLTGDRSQYFIENLDTLPVPAYHLLNMQKYFELAPGHNGYKQKPFMPMLTSRGCPAKCTFCAIANHWGPDPRYRSVENVLAEIDFLVHEYGIKEIHFEDDNLTADRERAMKIFDGLIERNYGLTWTVPSGMAAYSLDDELLEKMAQSGCYSISLAIENGNQEIVTKIIKKPILLNKIKPMVDKIRSLGMDIRGFFILGYPGETKVDIENTIKFARYLELDWSHFFIFAPLPGTEIYQTCINKGYLKPEDFDPLRSFYKSVLKTPEFDQEYLIEAKDRANLETNFKYNYNLIHNPTKAAILFQNVLHLYPHLEFARKSLEEANKNIN
jgi:magnesium-protoporphyrin IX monomethyl ester (oxidative) cyclase